MIDGRKVAKRVATTERHWIGLDEASRILGISATTLRRWSDAGVVETFVTPGGHRRFNLDAVRALLPGSTDRPTMEGLGETPERIARVYRRAANRTGLPWVGRLDEAQRTAFREHGRTIAAGVLGLLDATSDAERAAHLQAASEMAAEFGVAAALAGVPMSATVEAFLQFRRPFIDDLWSVAEHRHLETAAIAGLLRSAAEAFDQLLVATVRAHEAIAAEGPRAPRGTGIFPPLDEPFFPERKGSDR